MTTRRKLEILTAALAEASARASNGYTPYICHTVSSAVKNTLHDPRYDNPEYAAVMKHLAVTARKLGGRPDKYVWWDLPIDQREKFLHADPADRNAIRWQYLIEPRIECLKQTITWLEGYKNRNTRPDLDRKRDHLVHQ